MVYGFVNIAIFSIQLDIISNYLDKHPFFTLQIALKSSWFRLNSSAETECFVPILFDRTQKKRPRPLLIVNEIFSLKIVQILQPIGSLGF